MPETLSVTHCIQHHHKRTSAGVSTLVAPLVLSESSPIGGVVSEKMYQDVYSALLQIWPRSHDLELIYRLAVRNPNMLRGPFFSPHSTSDCEDGQLVEDLLHGSPHGLHPVLLARKLLLMSILFQQLPSHARSVRELAIRLLKTVASLVTANDELVQTVEGIECIALETMIHNNRGDLRQALLSLRRTMVLAQFMGLHKKEEPSLPHFIDAQTRGRIDLKYIWIHLVASDRYLSLMLGIPQAWTDNSFLQREPSLPCSPLEQLEKLLLLVGGRILDRNEEEMQDLATTQAIDRLLQRASNCMPPR